MNAYSHPGISISNALAGFAGQDEFCRRRLATVADRIMLAARGCGDFPVPAADVAEFARFTAFLAGEAELTAVGIVPDLGAADTIIRDMNGERFALTNEPA